MENFELKEDLELFCVQADSFPAGIQAAFKALEERLSTLAGRNVFGISYGDGNGNIIYKAAASLLPGEESKQFSGHLFTLRKGTYASELIGDFMNNITAIGITFQKMLSHPLLDKKACCVEWYKGADVLCLVRLEDGKIKQGPK
jgi:hypothetical protein